MPARFSSRRVLLVAPAQPPYGGMAVQAELVARYLSQDGVPATLFPSNFPLPPAIAILERIPVARTLARAVLIYGKLWRAMRNVDVAHVFAASWLYFWLVVLPAIVVGRMRGAKVIL